MTRIIEGRGTGKTKRLMEFAKENNAVFVCGNPTAMEVKAHGYGIIGLNFMSYGQYLSNFLRGQGEKKIVIDELETFLALYSGSSPIIGYTISEE